jgi:tetratricopeptide (TPR) repeat protein
MSPRLTSEKYKTMKKTLVFLISFLLSLSTFGQSDYSRGFQNGYKVGYCYNDYGCIPPIPPITPIPRIGESQDNYQDGYNRGFKRGLEDKQTKKSSFPSKTEIQGDNSSSVLQDTYSPVEFAQKQHMEKFQAQKSQYEQTEKNSSEGMKKYSLEIDGWEDQIGYEELNKKISAIRNGFIELNAAGLNLITPRSSQELMAYKALNEAMDDVRYKSSVWQSQKLAYDAATKIIFEQIIKKESERTIDIDATKVNMRTLLNTPGILNRSKITENLIVYKPIAEEIKVKNSATIITDNAEEYYNRGDAKNSLQDYKGAIADFTKAIELELKGASAYYGRGVAKIGLQDYKGAIADNTKAIELEPEYALAYYERGFAKYFLQDYKGAIADYTKSIELEPEYAVSYYSRGLAKNSLQDYKGAIADFTKAIELKPEDASAYYNRGEAKIGLQDYKGAIADYTKTIEIIPKFAWAYYVRGNAKGKLQDTRGAIADFTMAIELYPNNKEAFYNRGLAKIALSQKESGCLDLSKAGELGYAKAYEAIKKFCQ